MTKKTQPTTVARKLPILYVYTFLFTASSVANALAIKSNEVQKLSDLELSAWQANLIYILMVLVIAAIFLTPFFYIVLSKKVKRVEYALRLLLGYFVFGLFFVLGRGSYYNLAFTLVEIGFTLSMLKLVRSTK